MSQIKDAKTLSEASCADDYDPNSMLVDQARLLIRQFLAPITGTLRVPIRSALNRVVADDIVSPVNVPAHRNSAMDGWAVRFADLTPDGESTLTEVGTSFAGKPFEKKINAGECVRIMTGGVVPEGADCIVMQERAKASGAQIDIAPGQKLGQNLRHAGEDIKAGAIALRKGQVIRPAELGLIASLGIGEISIYRPLRVAFFSTGDELRSIGSPLGEGQIYDSNRYTIYGMLVKLGCEVYDMGVIADDPTLIENAFADASKIADVVITSGGVSVGEADFVKQMLNKLGEVLENRDETGPSARLRQNRQRPLLWLAGESCRSHGDVLSIRARGVISLNGSYKHRSHSHVQSSLHLTDQKSTGPHRVSARYFVAGCKRRLDRESYRRPRLGHS
jgi:molybdopterin molybdotransferase